MRRWPLVLLTFAGCAGLATEPEPEPAPVTAGGGLVSFDETPPAGAATYARPQWQVGDEFELERGGAARLRLSVAAIDERGYVLTTGGQVVLRRDLDLANLGEWVAAEDRPLHVLEPADLRYHWPLWLGKRWACEFTEVFGDGRRVPMRASCVVEDLDEVAVPAGTFAALRIVRRLQRVDQEGAPIFTQVIWYAPEVGHEVRQILADQSVELVSFQRR
ncbi:MAG: hypothetical protein H6838_04325 [Planctomycetes bacterium]|nr:hypothetical protein [Planctomycetota bacterium]MCB9884692.1 hypothetical protein [Planctomycetota bacterium]